MGKFLEMNTLPGLNQEETENMNRPIICTEIESVILKSSQQTEVQNQTASQVNSNKLLENN